MLTENDIIEILVEYFRTLGYTDIKSMSTLQRGIDITALNSKGIRLCIEAKGETSSKPLSNRYGKPFQGKQIASHVGGAILKTMVTMNDPKYQSCEFGIAFPLNHENLVRKFLPSLHILKIKVYLVSPESVMIL